MTTDEFNKKIEEKLQKLIKENKPLQLGVKSIMAIQSKRIWIDGKNKNGSNIGEYKGGEVYISPKVKDCDKRNLPGFELKGKGGEYTFKNGKKHKTGYFKSYVAFKKTIGRQKRNQSVDLLLTGTLQQEWSNSEVLNQANAKKIDENHYYVSLSQCSMDKVSRYNGDDNKVFGLSVKEKAQFLSTVQFELKKALQ